ncbi:P-loop NTPase fold protein [Bradyrhizobium sp. Ai1a-2]|uniref:P-loop NTPase fold protein n=1 Tax=Bradyrhizobium sp. Ai1a-2 TaxID=196490 RepID=UPI000422F243|nr:P-loop NTPase fold protein [Bradyrhizobium sp. Ai1a-2]
MVDPVAYTESILKQYGPGGTAYKNERTDTTTENIRSRQERAAPDEPALEGVGTVLEDAIAPPPDPLGPARDRGARLDDLLAFTWPETQEPYLSTNLEQLLRIAATQVGEEKILRPRHVFDALLHEETGRRQQGRRPTLPKMRDLLRTVAGAGDTPLGHFEFPSEQLIAATATGVAIGPELVAILLRTSLLRRKTNASYRDAGVRHFLSALLLEEIGRVAFDAAGLARPSFADLRDALTRMIENDVPYYAELSDDPQSWLPIVAEMREVSLPRRHAGETHAFTNDRTDVDLLGTRRDAAALADLLLLDDLAPPVAVGVFGAWGSGKSTLMRLIRREIEGRTAAMERESAASKVVQINFDAWSYADAENLWASLTAELFEQLADNIEGRESDGKLRTGLITEIAKRLRKDAEASPQAAAAIESQRSAVQDAEAKLTRLEHEPVAATVAGELARELIAKATPKPLSEDDKKKPDKVREAKEAEENKKRLDELLQAVGMPKGERDPEKLAPILSGLFDLPSQATLLFVLLRRSIGRGTAWGILVVAALLAIGAAGAWRSLGWLDIWAYVVSLLPSLAVLGPLIGGAVAVLRSAAPILQLAAEFLARKEKRAAELNSKRREAAETVKTQREKLDAMIAEQKKATEFAATYSAAAEGRSREGLLRYFISFSPELAEVRKKLGLLATVRRCFETLQQIMNEKRAATPASGEPAAGTAMKLAHVADVRRIIVYIDDLDRCSEQHVVQVLQAIYLLLAFELFVVVVAVDARWLHRAVGQVYRGQLSEPDQPIQSAGATVADYLEKIFQLPIWMRPIGNPAEVWRFIDGIDKPEEFPGPAQQGAAKERDRQSGGSIAAIDIKSDPALLRSAAQRRATLSEPERRVLASMVQLAGKSPRGLKRLVNTYRLIRVMRGPVGIADLEQGSAGKSPLYPYLLFALACEVGLKTETAGLVAEMARRSAPHGQFHPLVVCLFPDGQRDDTQARLHGHLVASGARVAVLAALRAVYIAAAGRNSFETTLDYEAALPGEDAAFADRDAASERFAEAFAEAARFTFRPRIR